MKWMIWHHELVLRSDVRVSPDDRGYVFGDGIYEVFRVYDGRIFEPEAHFERLIRTAEGTKLTLPYDTASIQRRLEELLDREGVRDGTIYLQITRGEAPRAHPFPAGAEPNLMAYCKELARPSEAMSRGISAVTLDDIRWLRCDLKTLNLLPNVLAKQEAVERGADDAIWHRSGTVTECSASNVMMVKDGIVRTHPANHLILHGITRAVVLRLAKRLEVPVREEAFTLEELASADELFGTGTTIEVMPIVGVDGRPVGNGQPGPVTRKLQQAFEEEIAALRRR
ncbi:D-amino-acid transaminase [Paenibacillus chartarius]|uniref:D-alanine aminotransferase n=1 Tax=Paenibacillus chartarius TaxID=747481 RepID=A0ABV6DEV8_9BACL